MAKVAISADFLTAFSRVPKAQQKKVREFTEKFRYNPTLGSINYEPILGARDPNVRTVRIGNDYRAVVLHPPKGDVYLLTWVDHHNEAMQWAKNKVFEINSETGALQIVDTTVLQNEQPLPAHSDTSSTTGRSGLFADYTDQDVLQVGVPELLLPSVRALNTDEDLERFQDNLPAEASEALFMLAAGFSMEEVKEELAARGDAAPVDTQDFAKALEHPDSKRRFAVVTTSQDLMEMLNQPLAKWRIFLHPSQEKMVKGNYNGPVRVLGGAGTGKTVVAMHRAKYLAEKLFREPTDKILFTTFTKNLARAIEDNLGMLCGEEKSRIEVIHLHAWSVRFMRSQGINFQIADEKTVSECWSDALGVTGAGDFDEFFYREEWDQVIETNDIKTLQEYLKAPRVGRGTRLSRPQRARVWQVFEEFKNNLNDRGVVLWLDIIRETRKYLGQKGNILPYQAVIVDEGQDFHQEEFKLIRALIQEGKNDLFIVGDAHQRIYIHKVVLGRCGINVRGRSKRLKINYRTSEEIRRWAVSLLEGEAVDDLDGGLDEQKGYKSLLHGPKPEIKLFENSGQEVEYIIGYIKSRLDDGVAPETICLVTREKNLLKDHYLPAFKKAGIQCVELDGRESDDGEGIRLASMHRVKGLEFTSMIVAAVNKGVVPLEYALRQATDQAAREEVEMRERSLLYVSATRARDKLLVTSYGEPSEFLQQR